MAELISIKAETRDRAGSRASKQCRRKGLVPAVVYGHGRDNILIAVSLNEFTHHLHHGAHLLELQLGAEKENVLIKAVQYDYLSTTPVHIDLARVDLNEVVTVTVPVNLRGTPAGVKEGGSLSQPITEVEISCVVINIPDEIRVRIEDMKIGDALHASDLALPEGAKLITAPETVIASVTLVSDEVAAAEGEAGEGGAEPEVISKGKEETEEDAKA